MMPGITDDAYSLGQHSTCSVGTASQPAGNIRPRAVTAVRSHPRAAPGCRGAAIKVHT
ncbi:hypothetical protein LY76DRAFT_597495 [Colletotrichum caudatum]|nr:hypothetical protein LY76DRAFT_597495 [Colletotrichum caudatum]